MFALIFVPFDPSVVGRKVPFFVPLQYSQYGGLYMAILGDFFEVFSTPFRLGMGL